MKQSTWDQRESHGAQSCDEIISSAAMKIAIGKVPFEGLGALPTRIIPCNQQLTDELRSDESRNCIRVRMQHHGRFLTILQLSLRPPDPLSFRTLLLPSLRPPPSAVIPAPILHCHSEERKRRGICFVLAMV